MNGIVGVLPAAGIASRLRPLKYPKELIPIVFGIDNETGLPRPIVSAEYSLIAMREAGIEKCIIIINENKTEILKYFGDGSELGIHLCYVIQSRPCGLPQAIMATRKWIEGRSVCMTLPDTVFRPKVAVLKLCDSFHSSTADLLLGVFPTSEPENLGPVRFEEDGRVIEVQDKPVRTDLRNTWGMAIWTPRFTSLLCDTVNNWKSQTNVETRERPIGDIFQAAVLSNFRVYANFFDDGRYIDVGKPEGIRTIILEGPGW